MPEKRLALPVLVRRSRFPQLLNIVKGYLGHNRRMCIIEHKLLFDRINPLRFVSNGICVSPENDDVANVLLVLHNGNNGSHIPLSGLFQRWMLGVPALTLMVCRRIQNLIARGP